MLKSANHVPFSTEGITDAKVIVQNFDFLIKTFSWSRSRTGFHPMFFFLGTKNVGSRHLSLDDEVAHALQLLTEEESPPPNKGSSLRVLPENGLGMGFV